MRLAPLYQQDREKAVQEGLEQGLEQGLERGLEQGLERGLEQGIQRGEANLVLRLLNRRLGQVPAGVEQQIRQLSIEQLEDLGEALLDFAREADLLDWLGSR